MNFPVPWRCLFPREAVDFVTYNGNAVLRELSDRTGAMISVSGESDTPHRLSDRIVTISGMAEQKELACRTLVEKLRKLQDLHHVGEVGFFVIIVPASAVPVIVGAKGATIKEVLEGSVGIELSIGKENIWGMPDTPIGLEGTADQVISAVAALHRVVQDMADRGRLMPSDFKYRPDKAALALAAGAGMGMPEASLPPSGRDPYGGMDPTQNFRTKAKLVVDTQTAGWLIGKGGRTIREMQENSGAFLHVLREEEWLPLMELPPGHRIVEICGRYERKLEGIQLVMRTADNMPGNHAPRDTLVLVPRALVRPELLREVADNAGCTVSPVPFDGAEVGADCEEAMVSIVGSVTGRIQAAQAFLTLTDKAHADGTVVARSVDGEAVGRDGRPRKEIRDDAVFAAACERSKAPPPNSRPQPNNGRQDAPQAFGPMPPRAAPQAAPQVALHAGSRAASQTAPKAAVEQRVAATGSSAVLAPGVRAARSAEASNVESPRNATPARAEPPRDAWASYASPTLDRDHRARALEASGAPAPADHAVQAQPTAAHASPSVAVHQPQPPAVGFGASAPQAREAPRPIDAPASAASASSTRQGVVGMDAPPSPAPSTSSTSWPGGPFGGVPPQDARILAGLPGLLASSTLCAQAPSRLLLLLPTAAVRDGLVPSGRLQEIARHCQVCIDLGAEVAPASRQVLLRGTVLANSVAAYMLQAGLHACSGSSSGGASCG